MKRVFDVAVAAIGLTLASPVLLPVCLAIWWHDFHSPFYIAPRVGRNDRLFRMVKLRSMIVNADKTGVDSTSAHDARITAVGRFVRKTKLDELTQLWNVLTGDMSMVGPRPNVKRETDLYTPQERRLLAVRPGITDFASIVFADEGEILAGSADPDIDYNQLIRPWKSRLGLLYVEHASLSLDVRLIWLTALAIVSRERALAGVQRLLVQLECDEQLRRIAQRDEPLRPAPPPGATDVVRSRQSTES